jgi:hypothetical protein|tara:strand:- start:95 stop:337 length:243 start_codon:yes stop_codon:yes gene_type:complete
MKLLPRETKNNTPFEGLAIGTEPETVENRFGGDSCLLNPEAVAVYDLIMGAESLGDYDTVEKGCSWFRENFPAEYMVLLD